jgi:uncharacterized protein YchJ
MYMTLRELRRWGIDKGLPFDADTSSLMQEFLKQHPEVTKLNLATTYVRPEHVRKVGRNDPCWCGSGQKYKRCCGKS